MGDSDDLDMVDDEFQTHDTTASFLNSGATVPTDLALRGSITHDDFLPHGAPSPDREEKVELSSSDRTGSSARA